jgi:hypothetical protein
MRQHVKRECDVMRARSIPEDVRLISMIISVLIYDIEKSSGIK